MDHYNTQHKTLNISFIDENNEQIEVIGSNSVFRLEDQIFYTSVIISRSMWNNPSIQIHQSRLINISVNGDNLDTIIRTNSSKEQYIRQQAERRGANSPLRTPLNTAIPAETQTARRNNSRQTQAAVASTEAATEFTPGRRARVRVRDGQQYEVEIVQMMDGNLVEVRNLSMHGSPIMCLDNTHLQWTFI